MSDDCAAAHNPMVAFYAAVEAVGAGQVAEAEVEHRHISTEGAETSLTMTVRREVRVFFVPPPEVLEG